MCKEKVKGKRKIQIYNKIQHNNNFGLHQKNNPQNVLLHNVFTSIFLYLGHFGCLDSTYLLKNFDNKSADIFRNAQKTGNLYIHNALENIT